MKNLRFAEVLWPGTIVGDEIVEATPPLPAAPVGVKQYWATDATRLDSSTGVRQFLVTAWYPAIAETERQRSGPLDLLFQNADSVLSFLIEKDATGSINLAAAKARLQSLAFQAEHGLQATAGPHPVLIFYPGGECHRFSKAGVCESLASLGYVVFALDAPRDAPILAFPDGRQVTGPMGENEDYIWPRVADIRFLLDQLALLNVNGPLAGCLELERIGMFGASRGGYLSNIMAVADERIKAAVNIDGFLWGLWSANGGTGLSEYPPEWQTLARRSRTPVLRLQGDQGSAAAVQANFARESQDFGGEFIYAALRGFSHGGFAPTPWLCGSIEACLKLDIMPDFRSYEVLMPLLSGFFGQHLRSQDTTWLSNVACKPEVELMKAEAS
jgi:dienelactone hydrolase